MAINKVKKHHNAGIFSFRLYFHDETLEGAFDPKAILEWRTPVPKRMNTQRVRCYLYQAESLPACDDTGASDPYIEVWTPDDQVITTVVVE